MPNKLLDILICSLYEREKELDNLCGVLSPQAGDDIGILVECDKREMSVGTKRNKLLSLATAEYVCFVDDDDMIAPNYVDLIRSALEKRPDCVGIEGIITFDGRGPRKFIHSKRYDHWFEKNGIYYRTPNHLNPVKRELAVQVGFPDSRHGEDAVYSSNLFPRLQSEEYIDGPIYFYNYKSNK